MTAALKSAPRTSAWGTLFEKADKKKRTILIPNLTPESMHFFKLALEKSGYKGAILPLADSRAVELGKRYVHNDICFPAQLNVGEVLLALQEGKVPREEAAAGLSKNCNACRALQYYVLMRRALDQAGYSDVPVVTSGKDTLGIHPGMKVGLSFRLAFLQGMLYVDALNDMRQKTIPYETQPEAAESVHADFIERGIRALKISFRSALRVLEDAVSAFNSIPVDRTQRKPVVGIIGEILVNYHPTANYNLVEYLRKNQMEPYLPPLAEFFRQDIVNYAESADRGFSRYPWLDHIASKITSWLFGRYLNPVERVLSRFRFYEKRESIETIRNYASEVINTAFNSGEGWILPGEIISMIHKGVRSFVIVQPFGCLPNHVSGRGLIHPIKQKYPDVQILSIDYDPDVSVGNIENRLQMLVMNARQRV